MKVSLDGDNDEDDNPHSLLYLDTHHTRLAFHENDKTVDPVNPRNLTETKRPPGKRWPLLSRENSPNGD
jgi:hypothetical protein